MTPTVPFKSQVHPPRHCNHLCQPSDRIDVLIFFIDNYGAREATVVRLPRIRVGLEPILRNAFGAKTPTIKATRAGAFGIVAQVTNQRLAIEDGSIGLSPQQSPSSRLQLNATGVIVFATLCTMISAIQWGPRDAGGTWEPHPDALDSIANYPRDSKGRQYRVVGVAKHSIAAASQRGELLTNVKSRGGCWDGPRCKDQDPELGSTWRTKTLTADAQYTGGPQIAATKDDQFPPDLFSLPRDLTDCSPL
ncbi:hypothetical protein PCL_01629 [Purpureocillium lilacinum]|uniref:Uncharacterized protein n=1 Tax=Purpureocillium lilacinum TaxID=33203 RepID=A0A2U3E215_PURLI|nr:hypothetical protein PCL_01629 [Purpureocillium lilacinum]